MDRLDFERWDETDFEEFCFQLLDGLDGFSNVDWRRGTPKRASPADRGRDIVVEVERIDVDQSKHVETWFVDCKHYSKGVPPEALQGLLAWANAERPDVALVIVGVPLERREGLRKRLRAEQPSAVPHQVLGAPDPRQAHARKP
jgi:hypothetical protein